MTDPTLPPPPTPPIPPASPSSGAAQSPPPPAAPRRGMPVWGRVLITVGAAMLIGLVVIVVVIVAAVNGLRDDSAAPVVPPTSPAETVDPGETLAPVDGSFSLDTLAPAPMGPFWSVPGDMLTEWDTVVFDVDGLNHFQNADLGCDFRTYQSMGVGDPAGPSDRAASEAQMDVLAQVWVGDGITDVTREPQSTVWLGYDLSDEVEFLVDRVDGTYADTGVETTTYLIGREFLSSGGALAARLECRADTMDGPDSPLGWILDELAAVTF